MAEGVITRSIKAIRQWLVFVGQGVAPVFRWIFGAYVVLAAAGFVRDELLPPEWRQYHIFDFLPNWSWETWIVIAFWTLLLAVVDYAWKLHRSGALQPSVHQLQDPYGAPLSSLAEQPTSATPILVLITLAIVLVAWIHNKETHHRPTEVRQAAPPPAAAIPTGPQPALYYSCQMRLLPIHVAPESTAHVVALNKKHMTPAWGFYEVRNDSPKESQWPDMRKLRQRKFNPGVGIYECNITNYGPAAVLSTAIPLRINFLDEPVSIVHTYDVVIDPLDVHGKFTFYVVNDCPVYATIVMPNSLRIVGENRQLPLRRFYRDPVEPIMMFFGSEVNWTDNACQ